MKKWLIPFGIVVCVACEDPAPAADPPVPPSPATNCAYASVEIEGTVTAVERLSEDDSYPYYHVELSFDTTALSTEPQSLEQHLGRNLDSLFLARHNIQYGTTIPVRYSELTSGENCEPYQLVFEKALDD